MAKSKVLDLASEVGLENDKLLVKLKRMGVKMKDAKKSLEPEKAAAPLPSDEKIIEKDAAKEVVEKRVKPTVIRRRTRTFETKAEPPASAPPEQAAADAMPFGVPIPAEIETPPPVKHEEKLEAEPKREEAEAPVALTAEPKTEESPAQPVPEIPPATLTAAPASQEASPPAALKAPGPEIAAETKPPVPPPIPKETKTEARTAAPEPPKPASKKEEVKPPAKVLVPEEEKAAFPAKKKPGAGRKRRIVEERMVGEDDFEPEEKPGKEAAVEFKPFRPMRRKVVMKATARKTEVTVPKAIKRIIRISEMITAGDLAKRMGVKGGELIKKLMEMGVMATINQTIDADVASLVASEFGYEVEKLSLERQDLLERKEDLPEQLKLRPPVVTIMGHVDHGKTTLLDAIRKTNVVEAEAGGITQHIGAYDVELDNGRVVFIDTPGHEAFTAMRARGAQVTDIVVLVVAADDGMMPQTKEAIDHARAAKVPIVVAVNKVDRPNANPEKVRKELAEYGLMPEQWGGTTLFAEVSAKQQTGIKELLESILLQAEVLELRANPNKSARGVIVESRLDKGRGPVATLLVQEGTLHTGDVFIAGSHYGRVRAMLDDKGQKIEEAGPSTPVEVVGFADVPEAGETFIVVQEERMAKQISLYRQEKLRAKELSKLSKVSLNELYDQIKKGEMKELNVIIKADVQGSIEAMKEALGKLSTAAVKVNILHDAVGGITETDVNLASASNAIIIGFNVRPIPKAQLLAEQEHVDVRVYSIIYDAISDIRKALEGLLEPTYKERVLGRAQVIQVFNVRKVGTIAGSLIVDGKVVRGSHARILRDSIVVYNGKLASLKKFKDDMKECSQGAECGIWVENFNDVKLGDIIESYEIEQVQPHLG